MPPHLGVQAAGVSPGPTYRWPRERLFTWLSLHFLLRGDIVAAQLSTENCTKCVRKSFTKARLYRKLGKWEEPSLTTEWLFCRPLPGQSNSRFYTEAPPYTLGGLCAPTVSCPEMQPIYTLHLVCLSMKVNTLGVVLLIVFDHNSK